MRIQMSQNLETIVDQLSNLTVMQAAELSKLLEDKWGVSAAAPVAAAAAPVAAAAAAAEQTEFTITLKDSGANKISVIKELRALMPALGLKEAKDLADAAPKVVKEGASKADVEAFKQKLEAAGATVTIS
jgi:large subunit ribosomal protein L7/L12